MTDPRFATKGSAKKAQARSQVAADLTRSKPLSRRSLVLIMALILVGPLAALLFTKSERPILQVNGLSSVSDNWSGAAALTNKGDRVCFELPRMPAEAKFAKFRLSPDSGASLRAHLESSPVRAAAAVGTAKASSDQAKVGASQTVNLQPKYSGSDLIATMLLPQGVASDSATRLCLVNEAKGLWNITPSAMTPVLQITTGERSFAVTQISSMLSRVGISNGRPLHWMAGQLAALSALLAALIAVSISLRRAANSKSSRRLQVGVLVVAMCHALAWAWLIPPTQGPDEGDHYINANRIATTGKMLSGTAGSGLIRPHDIGAILSYRGETLYPEEFQNALLESEAAAIARHPGLKPPWDESSRAKIFEGLKTEPKPQPDIKTNAADQPPLYYLSAALGGLVPGTYFDKLSMMRIITAGWFVLAVFAAMALIRELFPKRFGLDITVGLLMALFPMLAFMGGSLSPDSAMVAFTFLAVLAAVRVRNHGLNVESGLMLGLATAGLMLSKMTAWAVLPGILFIAVTGGWNQLRSPDNNQRRQAVKGLLEAAGVVVCALLLYAAYAGYSGRSILPGSVSSAATASTRLSGSTDAGITDFIASAWQIYLPRLPMLNDRFPGSPLWDTWLNGTGGRFGQMEYGLPKWTNWILIAALLATFRALRKARTKRELELDDQAANGLVISKVADKQLFWGFLLMIVCVLAVIARADFSSVINGGPHFTQARYLFPLLPVAMVAIALAQDGVSARWKKAVGPLLIAAFAAWALVALGITVGRYYG